MKDKDTSVIPYGVYCYRYVGDAVSYNGKTVGIRQLCPYWQYNPEKDEQLCGYCMYIETGDWVEGGTMLLWDMCKECGVNEPDYEDLENNHEGLPTNWENPDWETSNKVHDWRNHVSDGIIKIWDTFSQEQKMAIAISANDEASNEEWE